MSNRRFTFHTIMLIACFCPAAPVLSAGQQTFGTSKAPDSPAPAIVREKIEALGLLDNTLLNEQQPSIWLEQRLSTVEPNLIQGLDHKEMRVASECLRILAERSQSPEFIAALLRIAANATHPLNSPATLALCPFSSDPRAKVLLEKALPDSSRFPKPEERSRIAEALGRKSEAVHLMVEQIESEKDDGWERSKWIGRLGDIGDPSAVPALEKLTRVRKWDTAVPAFLALAKVDPKGHGLTNDQRTFLEQAGRAMKISREDEIKRARDLARLDKTQIRPYVLWMLRSDEPGPALTILGEWKDREALPEIKRLMSAETTVGWMRNGFITAWLTIDGADAALEEFVSLLGEQSGEKSTRKRPVWASREEDLRAALQAPLSNEQKLSLLRRAKGLLDKEDPRIIPWVIGREDEQGVLLKALMKEESDITALAVYAEKAGGDPEKRFGDELRHALDTLAAAGDIPHEKKQEAAMILEACSKQELRDTGPTADRFLDNSDPGIRFAAAHLSAVSGGDRPKALSMLLGSLKDTDGAVRYQASLHLAGIPCLDARERSAREAAILVLVGTPMEDYALRLLPGCEGDKTSKKLTPLLDDKCTSRAVYAAWVLAQHPDTSTREKALRRFAIYAWFQHQMHQQGSGIGFTIAPQLSFGQVTSSSNTNAYRRARALQTLTIPPALLDTFDLDKEEQSFSIRAYRTLALDFPDFRREIILGHPFRPRGWKSSHLPLLETVSREDPDLRVLYVRGEKVADFPNRRATAQVIAKVTGKPAVYHGLAGERIDSAAFPPKPYQEQDVLVARYLLDRIEKMGVPNAPLSDAAHRKRDSMSRQLSVLTSTESSGFGKDLRMALRAEAEKRGIAARLRNAGFAVFVGEN